MVLNTGVGLELVGFHKVQCIFADALKSFTQEDYPTLWKYKDRIQIFFQNLLTDFTIFFLTDVTNDGMTVNYICHHCKDKKTYVIIFFKNGNQSPKSKYCPRCAQFKKTEDRVINDIISTGIDYVKGSYIQGTGRKNGGCSFSYKCRTCKVEIRVKIGSWNSQIKKAGRFQCRKCCQRGVQEEFRETLVKNRVCKTSLFLQYCGITISWKEIRISLQVSSSKISFVKNDKNRKTLTITRFTLNGYENEIIYYLTEQEMKDKLKQFETERHSNQIRTIKNLHISDAIKLLSKFTSHQNPWKLYIPIKTDKPDICLPIPPYIMGLWLGDGTSVTTTITNIDQEIINEWYAYAESIKCKVTRVQKIGYMIVGSNRFAEPKCGTETVDRVCKKVLDGEITGVAASLELGVCKQSVSKYICQIKEYGSMAKRVEGNNIFLQHLKTMNLIDNKHIPPLYMRGSISQKSELLAGLIDSDGYIRKRSINITQKKKHIIDDVAKIADSLGWFSYQTEIIKTCTNSPIQAKGLYHSVTLTMCSHDTIEIPCRLFRKRVSVKDIELLQPPSVTLIDKNNNDVEKFSDI
jgi:hypothetical protein